MPEHGRILDHPAALQLRLGRRKQNIRADLLWPSANERFARALALAAFPMLKPVV
jgi:hypothetical protein